MGRELQKRKNRSGISKAVRKPKSKKRLLQHPIIAANWDKNQTLEQNYKRLGLTSRLNKYTGGTEKKAEDVLRMREDMDETARGNLRRDDPLAIASMQKKSSTLNLQEARIERDPETGKILRVLDSGEPARKANPLNDPLNDLDDDSESEVEGPIQMFDQHGHVVEPASGSGKRTEVVELLEKEAAKPMPKKKQHQSEGERAFIEELVAKYGDDYTKMARDTTINYMQRSEGDLKKRIKKWRAAGGTIP